MKDGGSAYPVVIDDSDYECGMTMRDWFAGQALLSAFEYQKAYQEEQAKRGGCGMLDAYSCLLASRIANRAYEIADAMIEERVKLPKEEGEGE